MCLVKNETTSDLKQCGVDTIPFAEEKCNVEACTPETSTEPPKEELIEICEEVETDDYEDESSGSGDETTPAVESEALTQDNSTTDAPTEDTTSSDSPDAVESSSSEAPTPETSSPATESSTDSAMEGSSSSTMEPEGSGDATESV